MDRCNRPEPPHSGSEKEMLSGFLGFLRGTIVCKLDGLTDEELRRSHVSSGMTLLGLVKHLTDVERSWFRETFLGEDLSHLWDDNDRERYWRIEPGDTTEALLAGYREEVRRAEDVVQRHSLNEIANSPRPGMEGLQLRWIVVHMIEETARHCGHADLIRETIDGQIGE